MVGLSSVAAELALSLAVLAAIVWLGWPGNWSIAPGVVEAVIEGPARRGVVWFGGEPED